MRISDWSSDVCSSDLPSPRAGRHRCASRHIRPPDRRGSSPRSRVCGRRASSSQSWPPLPHQHEDERRAGQRKERVEAGERDRSEEHTSELQSLMRISYAVFCLKKKKDITSQYQKERLYKTQRQQQHNTNHLPKSQDNE